ncbi:MAG: hypothetical protein U0230_13985 [Polyangiales bacterium]
MIRRGIVCVGLSLLFLGCLPASGTEQGAVHAGVVELQAAGGPVAPTACVTGLRGAGESPVCSSCECGRCAAQANACAGDPKCAAAAACENANYCQGAECYCGNGISAAICLISPQGPCKAQFEAAAGVKGWTRIKAVLDSGDTSNSLVRAARLASCSLGDSCKTQCGAPGAQCTFDNEVCQERRCPAVDTARENARASSANVAANPTIQQIYVNGTLAWSATNPGTTPTFRPRDRVALVGAGFGSGVDVDYAKILIGNSRVLETNLQMFEQKLDIADEINYETTASRGTWGADVISWNDGRVEFYVPIHASRGPLRMQVQKRVGSNSSLLRHGQPHQVVNAITMRIRDTSYPQTCDVVSELSNPVGSASIPVNVVNPSFDSLVTRGRQIFWSYDYNIGLAHKYRGLDWDAIFAYRTTDPMTGQTADPATLFGAVRAVAGEVPTEATADVYFDPYPQQNPIPGFLLTPQLKKGNTRGTGWVGYRYAQSSHPFNGPGEWIGFNCASCHGYRLSYERAPGQNVTRVIPGLPNPNWSMKWSLLGDFEGVRDTEPGPTWAPGDADVDKTSIVYAVPPGAGEHALIRHHGDGSSTENDYQFSPITIPNVTNHMPIRRALSHTEAYVGFEGSYIHSEEPDGATGSMDPASLQALTAYMTTLDANDNDLRNVGMYRWLKYTGQLAGLVGNVSEGQFVQSGHASYPALRTRVDNGRAIFEARCGNCHTDAIGANTNERMIRLDQVGRFFPPTIYQRQMQAIRVTYLRDLYWVQHRGLLSDGHVRNLTDLVDPNRCTEGTALYNRYYTVHAPTIMSSAGPDFPALQPGANPRGDAFRVARMTGTDATSVNRNRFVERHQYFTTMANDPTHYYWDYQAMRRNYGPNELGSAAPIGMPAAPHPWCAGSQEEIPDLLLFLMTL